MSAFKKPLALAISSTILSGLSSSAVNAKTIIDFKASPFALSELSDGYMQLAKSDKKASGKMKDGACGEGSCGGAMMKGSEEKTAEGNCAGNKPMPTKTNPVKTKKGNVARQ
ncbi:MAG: hypothetical protein HFP77_02345 [Methylococcales symbiont of Iophon sp. n. MRB-2018]|nr:MAG: hypothetical protein HFP77_02345 [Methylococcales symbiont of Iophon sp. n. MRB-2018]KAF3979136.1 MAG: hypothetical protein HFP76_08535 [Methylococcales symbiont of Iophon sp. n. MRB-2018]